MPGGIHRFVHTSVREAMNPRGGTITDYFAATFRSSIVNGLPSTLTCA
jgi:hypothetical protein